MDYSIPGECFYTCAFSKDGKVVVVREKIAKVDESKQMDFAKVEKRVRTTGGGSTGTVRNLRIREDTAKYLDEAGVDIILVGDSLAQVILGYDNTVDISMDEMLIFTRAVSRGVNNALVVHILRDDL